MADSMKRRLAETEKAAAPEPELVINITGTTSHTATVQGENEIARCLEKAKSISSDMLAAIRNLEKQCGSADSREFRLKKEQLLMAQFNEIIGSDPFFGDLLRQLKEVCEHTRRERDQLAKEKVDLGKRIKEATKETEKQTAMAEAQKSAIAGVKLQLANATKELGRYKQRCQDLDTKRKRLEESLATALDENANLACMIKKVYDKEGDSEFDTPSPEPATFAVGEAHHRPAKGNAKLNRSMLEVGKRRVQIPVLDFTRLPPGKPSKLTVVQYKDSDTKNHESSSSAGKNGTLVLEQELIDGTSPHGIRTVGSSENPDNVADGEQDKVKEMLHNLIESAGEVGPYQHHHTP